jgi:hypothetical protein
MQFSSWVRVLSYMVIGLNPFEVRSLLLSVLVDMYQIIMFVIVIFFSFWAELMYVDTICYVHVKFVGYNLRILCFCHIYNCRLINSRSYRNIYSLFHTNFNISRCNGQTESQRTHSDGHHVVGLVLQITCLLSKYSLPYITI